MKSQQTFSVMFLARKGKKDPDNSLIYMRITANGQRVKFSLKRKVPTELWDKKRGNVRRTSLASRRTQQYLNQISSEVFDAYDGLRREGAVVTPQAIKARFLREDEDQVTLLGALDYHYKVAKTTIKSGRPHRSSDTSQRLYPDGRIHHQGPTYQKRQITHWLDVADL